MTVDDTARTHPLAMILRDKTLPPPMATCPHDDEPLISTFEFRGAEFYCLACHQTYGFLAPKPAIATPALNERLDVLKARYATERAARESPTKGTP